MYEAYSADFELMFSDSTLGRGVATAFGVPGSDAVSENDDIGLTVDSLG
jgi:hypothetical protein